MAATRRAMIAGLAVVALLALAVSVDARSSSVRPAAKASAVVSSVEAGGFLRVALERNNDQGARSESGLHLSLTLLAVLCGLGFFITSRHARRLGGGYFSHAWPAGPAWVRGPPRQLI